MWKKLLLVSYDAVGSDELSLVREMPNFRRAFEKGRIFPDLKTVFMLWKNCCLSKYMEAHGDPRGSSVPTRSARRTTSAAETIRLS